MKLGSTAMLIRWITVFAIIAGLMSITNPSDTMTVKASKATAFMGITVTNSSTNRTISHLYVSQLNPEVWSADLISQPLTAGQSFTIQDVSCAGNEIKVIAEDQQGCFSYAVLSCAQATTAWTITNDSQIDCGAN